ncbi:PEP-utilizing enzyme, partial [Acinetobacter baumannii]|uniref:PEP-utilizing enzyme n=1 Tax=Acinetobacter baumannii TaxID=470 RepID=UPI000A5D72FC
AIGGASAPSEIVARAFGISAIVGAGEQVLEIDPKSTIIINGDTGTFVLDPDAAQIDKAKPERAQQRQIREETERQSHEPAITLNQQQIEIA